MCKIYSYIAYECMSCIDAHMLILYLYSILYTLYTIICIYSIYRLVYIRGSPEQNIHALQIIIDKVGGWPYTTPIYDNELSRIEEKLSLFIPFLAIPAVLFEISGSDPTHFSGSGGTHPYEGYLFPMDSKDFPHIAGMYSI